MIISLMNLKKMRKKEKKEKKKKDMQREVRKRQERGWLIPLRDTLLQLAKARLNILLKNNL